MSIGIGVGIFRPGGGETGPIQSLQPQPIPHDATFWNGVRAYWGGRPARWRFAPRSGFGYWNGAPVRWNGQPASWGV